MNIYELVNQLRIRIATQCRDFDDFPRVPDAGNVVPGNPGYQVMHNGVKTILGSYHGAWMEEIIRRLRGCHEPQEEKVFFEVLKEVPPGGTMLELGCCWAYYSLWFNHEIDGAVNHMIEPNAVTIEQGRMNFELNGMNGLFTHAFIGSHAMPEATFTDWDGTVTKLPMVSVDDYLERHDIQYLDILHADIQGAEMDMLHGCERAISENRIGFFFVSTHDDKHDQCLAFFRQNNIQIIAEHTIEESYSSDGLIVARSASQPRPARVSISKREEWLRVRHGLRVVRERLRGTALRMGLLK